VEDYFNILTPKRSIEDGMIIDKDLIHYIINEELNRRKIKTRNAYLTINSSKIITREIIIPKVDTEEINSILKFQVEDYIPVDISNYVIQYKIIGQVYEDDIEKLKILIIAIPKSVVEDYHKLMINLNLNPLVLDYQPNSLAKLIKYNETINGSYPTEDLTFACVDIGYDGTKISIIRNGIVLVSRIVDIGGNYIDQSILNLNDNIQNLEAYKDNIDDINHVYDDESENYEITSIIKNSILALTEKIEIVFRYYLTRKKDNKINMILLTGGISRINGLDNLFSNTFSIPSININSLNNIKFSGEFSDYANAIGSIIRASEV